MAIDTLIKFAELGPCLRGDILYGQRRFFLKNEFPTFHYICPCFSNPRINAVVVIGPVVEHFLSVKLRIIVLSISLIMCFGWNRLIETVLLSSHNICFG